MKKLLISLFLVLVFLSTGTVSANSISLIFDNEPINISYMVVNSTTYVALRAVTEILIPDAEIIWENNQAVVRTPELHITAKPGNLYIEANARLLYVKDGVKLINGSTMVPVRVIAKAMGAEVTWDECTKSACINKGTGIIQSGDKYYNSDSLYWLSRIISAESKGESLIGKIAVGNVVLNRVECSDFPNTIYDVIFDNKWGVQFQPTANGTIYNNPDSESVLAAKLCLDGANVAGDSLFFLNPGKSTNFWTSDNRSYMTSIGGHVFYS